MEKHPGHAGQYLVLFYFLHQYSCESKVSVKIFLTLGISFFGRLLMMVSKVAFAKINENHISFSFYDIK